MNKHPFEYHSPTSQQVERIRMVRERCRKLYDELLCIEPSRERSLAVTKLEEVSMWANKAVVLGPDKANLPTEDDAPDAPATTYLSGTKCPYCDEWFDPSASASAIRYSEFSGAAPSVSGAQMTVTLT